MNNHEPKRQIALRPIVVILLVVFIFGLADCMILNIWGINGIAELIGPPPGKGAKAERGYQVCQPIIEALDKYYMAEGEYPLMLKSLSPAYIGDVSSEVNGSPIIYRTTKESYRLEFSYTGPGMNICTYTPENDWHCYGYY
jgi:hypothetical protein